jgi:hypothetical protein
MAIPNAAGTWVNTEAQRGILYTCPFCGSEVAPEKSYRTDVVANTRLYPTIRICPRCNYPTLLTADGEQTPGVPMGRKVDALPDDVERFYSEARRCGTVNAYAGVVLLCRTLLMHLAVDRAGARLGADFTTCVNALDSGGWVAPNGRPWLEAVRVAGNKAAHRADPITKEEAETIMHFVEQLLRTLYELPARFTASAGPAPAPPAGPGTPPTT